MTPKEKAIELVDSYYHCAFNGEKDKEDNVENAIDCAIIAINELIREHTFKSPIAWNYQRLRYWNEVKKEIEKL